MSNSHSRNKVLILMSLITIALIVVFLSWTFIFSSGNLILEDSAIKIGIIGHFSGEYASYGIPMKNAIELAVKEINNNGGVDGKNLELIVEDDVTDSTKAVSGVSKLINVDKVDYIISVQGSGATSSIIPSINDNKKLLMITLGSAPGLADDKEYIFRSVPSDVYQASEMAEYINLNFKSVPVAGLYRNDAYGKGIQSIIEDNLDNIVVGEVYDVTSSDVRTQLTKIKESNSNILIVAGEKSSYPIIFKQMIELDMNLIIFTSETFYDKEVLNDIDVEKFDSIYTFFPEDPVDYVSFSDKYVNEFNEEPSAYSMYAYDGTMALIKALENSDNVEDVKRELKELSFSGASGTVSFDVDGDRSGIEYSVYRVVDGEFVVVE